MYLIERLWGAVTTVLGIVTLSRVQDGIDTQRPMLIPSQILPTVATSHVGDNPLVFRPPGAFNDDTFTCNYTAMVGWEPCSTPMDRKCWLKRISDGKQYDITTNYEEDVPIGTLRQYKIDLSNQTYDADGMEFDAAKLFNSTYPGPWLEACWGDTVEINVTNSLPYNGTSIHWHGIRQNQTMHMDGVNGITQCPIAPGDYFVYKFNITQYGSSWYHSHYSVQYADGAVGPMTLHGPSSLEYDEAISPPLIMTDWGHNSAFNALTTGLAYPDILLNGRGSVTNFNNATQNTTKIKAPYNITFGGPLPGQSNKKYLIRIINTSFDTTFVFSIDHHNLTIVSADFVPILPYTKSSVLVGIGQRYNIIVEANPLSYNDGTELPTDGNYWIRTYIAPCIYKLNSCNAPDGVATCNYERTGILRYNIISTALPTTLPWDGIPLTCSDEDPAKLSPVLQWTVGEPVNGPDGEDFGLALNTTKPQKYPLAAWTLSDDDNGFSPIRVDYNNITFLNLDHTGDWDPLWRIIPEDYTSTDWVYLVIMAGKAGGVGAHPIHLHGHDFALLEQSKTPWNYSDPPDITRNRINPPRRDVVLMPKTGYIVIAFKADNPGAWLVHCHIAFHIAEGLGLQIMERQEDANHIWNKTTSPAIKEAERVCGGWKGWQKDHGHWAPNPGCTESDPEMCFQDDSGV